MMLQLASKFENRRLRRPAVFICLAIVAAALLVLPGCYAPLHSYGVPAPLLPDSFRTPVRSGAPELNYSSLTIPPQADYILGPNDILEVIVHGLYPDGAIVPLRAQVMASGNIQLPLVGAVPVGGRNLLEAQVAITKAYADGFLEDPRVSVALAERATTSVLVLGEVAAPGVYRLPKYENDVAHALAVAGGLREDAGQVIEVHRRLSPAEIASQIHAHEIHDDAAPASESELPVPGEDAHGELMQTDPAAMRVVQIPLRGYPTQPIVPEDIVLNAGDVVVVPSRVNEVFYVVGKLSTTNFTRFNIGARERDLGAGFLLPRDRDLDVLTAVAMAGYIDPIDSPTTVTVQRTLPNGKRLLILVDLIKARYDRRQSVLVQPGDIIYINPDAAWWIRRTLDRVIPDLIGISYERLLFPTRD